LFFKKFKVSLHFVFADEMNYKLCSMKKLSSLLLLIPSLCLGQARIVINGATPVTIVENGGTLATPVYIEVNNSATNAITNIGGNLGWIISENEFNMVKWDIGTNTGSFILPFGYQTSYFLPETFDITTAGTGAGSILFSTYHTIADQWTGVVSLTGRPSDVTQMDASIPALGSPSATDDSYYVVDRFWIIDPYTFAGYTVYPVSTIKFSYIDLTPNLSPSEVAPNNQAIDGTLLAQRFNSAAHKWDDWQGQLGNNAVAHPVGTCSVTAVPAADFFRSWTLSGSADPLPIELTQMGAACINNTAQITWTCATQTNNKSFTVERSPDQVNWEPIATIAGAGNSSTAMSYEVMDNSPLAGSSYYRLSQTDFDGTTTANNLIPFDGCSSNETTISAFNNTSSGNIVVRINSAFSDTYTITLVNTLGQVILSQPNKSLNAGYNEIMLSPGMLSQGIYLINIKSDRANYSKKLILGKL
jgi:Secretion system C-terminal sorting domain